MSKVGVSISINLSKLDKSRFFQGSKGLYLDLTTFINLDTQDEYGNNGFVKQSMKKDERVDLPIAGNVKVFWSDSGQQSQQQAPAAPAQNQQQNQQQGQSNQSAGFDNFEESDEIPF